MADKIAESIINKLGPEGRAYLKEHGELPAIKLTKEELEFLHGGGRGPLDTLKDIWDFVKDNWK